MNITRALIAPAALAGLAIAPAAAATGKQDFVLHNATGYTIAEVYVSAVNVDNWEEDVMGRDVLDDGEQVTINFTPDQKICHYDLKVVWDDGDEATWDDFDLCKVSDITLHWKNGKAWADYE